MLVQSAHRVGKPLAGIIVRTPRERVLDAGGPPLLLEGVEYEPLVRGRLPEALAEERPEPKFPPDRGLGSGAGGVLSLVALSAFAVFLPIEARTASISASTELCCFRAARRPVFLGVAWPMETAVSCSMNSYHAETVVRSPSGKRQVRRRTPAIPALAYL